MARAPGDDVVTFMYVPGRSGQIRRYSVPRYWIRRASVAGVVLSIVIVVLGVDYVRARHLLGELEYLRNETGEQREQLAAYSEQVGEISEHLARVS